MNSKNSTTQKPIIIREKTVACDGENHKPASGTTNDTNDSGHPKVYLNVGEDGSVTCPYCGLLFIYER